MKKIIYCLVAALALVACTPKNGADQVIRIGVSLDDDAQPNQKAQQRISAEDNGSVIEILWEEDDVLYYQLDGESINMNNPFKLISGAETKNAFFECATNPDELIGKKFNLYYNGAGHPDGVIPTSQQNEANTVNHDYLFYTATDCKLESVIKLEPKFALFGVQLVVVSDQKDKDINDIKQFKQYLVLGNRRDSNGFIQKENVEYMCTHVKSVNLNDVATFYFALPEEYNLSGKYIGLVNGLENYTSQALQLPNITLDSNQAQIITIYVTRNTGLLSDNNNAYKISSTNN